MARTTQVFYDSLPIPLQEVLVSIAGWRSFRQRFGTPFRQAFLELQRTDENDAEAVAEDQNRRLRDIIEWASRTVPHYRDVFRKEGIDPASIRTSQDLRRIPMLSKAEVQQNPTRMRSENFPRRKAIVGRTSGTTGTPLVLYQSPEAMGWEYAVNLRQRSWFGIALRERFATFGGQSVVPLEQTSPPFWRYDWPGNRTLFSLYHMSPHTVRDYALELHRPIYRFWQGYPSSIGLICQHLDKVGVELGDAEPRTVFTSSETLLEFHRALIEKVTGARVADRYGNAEFCVSALQCPEGQYHVDTEFCVIEIDPHEETDTWVRGEIIATGLANRAMPFIRYRTGDIATLEKHGSCACGRKRPVLRQIDGRIEDTVVTPEGRRIGRLDHVFKGATGVREAQIVQDRTDLLTVRVVATQAFDEQARADLEREFRRRLGDTIHIDYEACESLEREANGKFRAVVSTLPEARIQAGSAN